MATFLLEVGTEELPAGFLDEAFDQWRSRIPASLDEHFLTPEAVEVYGTPRRLAVLIRGLPERQPDREEEAKGPPAQAAFKDGKPTKAAQGFARSRGVDVSALEVRETDKGEFVFVQLNIPGRPAAEVLTELIPDWILKLEGKRFMRWGDGDLRFPRPIRWLITLLDDTVLPLTLENGSESCSSDRTSQGHRILSPGEISIPTASDYLDCLRRASIEVDPAQRRSHIVKEAQAAAKKLGGEASISESLLDEVVNLVETPTVVVGQFDPAFLEIPSEVTITEMESHQRYFPVLKAAGSAELLPYFITVSNGDPTKSELISAGNERVIRARLSDGKFFFDADRKLPLEGYLEQLKTVTFQQDIGSVRGKVDRIVHLAELIADQLQVTGEGRSHTLRAALLCKADLVTQMVGEFPELQGVMGQKYALASGEPVAVADAIVEHYLPKGADDELPQTLAGQIVGMADRLDTLISIFSLGMIPTGSSDPFALRRAANAVVNVTWRGNLAINLRQLLDRAIAAFTQNHTIKKGDAQTLQASLEKFFLQRLQSLLQDEWQIGYDLILAVVGNVDAETEDLDYKQRALSDVLDVRDRAQFLQTIRADGTLAVIYETVNRASRLAAQGELDTDVLDPKTVVEPKLFQQSSEQAFYDALVKLLPQTQSAQANRDYQTLVEALTAISPVVSQFFDGEDSVLVMDKDSKVRRNRLNLLGLLRNHARVLADFGAIVKQ
ncbi:MAG: glycine--tRNA ligase subunit beta, partial [Elainellaceae cyanobacterium]